MSVYIYVKLCIVFKLCSADLWTFTAVCSMYIHACVCAFVYLCLYVYIRACEHACVLLCVCSSVGVNSFIHTCIGQLFLRRHSPMPTIWSLLSHEEFHSSAAHDHLSVPSSHCSAFQSSQLAIGWLGSVTEWTAVQPRMPFQPRYKFQKNTLIFVVCFKA